MQQNFEKKLTLLRRPLSLSVLVRFRLRSCLRQLRPSRALPLLARLFRWPSPPVHFPPFASCAKPTKISCLLPLSRHGRVHIITAEAPSSPLEAPRAETSAGPSRQDILKDALESMQEETVRGATPMKEPNQELLDALKNISAAVQ